MPELPEVETISSDLRSKITGKRLNKIAVPDDFDLKDISSEEFIDRTLGKIVTNVKRIGKMLCWELDSGENILFHLKMTGIFTFFKKTSEIPKHVKIIFEFDDGTKLNFSDTRKFGVVRVCETKKLHTIAYISNLGIDPTSDNYDVDSFKSIIKKHPKKTIKSFLMDQHLICGIGNIYASEIMFKIKVNPQKHVSSLNEKQILSLYQAIKDILLKAIRNRGTTFSDYRDTIGNKGTNQDKLKVYNRAQEKCFDCDDTIIRIVQNNRSTFFCPTCQR